MREFTAWSVVSSIFSSVALFSSGFEAVNNAVSLAAAGNPAAVERSLSSFVSRMGGEGIAVPAVVSEAAGKTVAMSNAPAPRLAKQRDWVLAKGDEGPMSNRLSGLLGLTDGTTGYDVKLEAWQDDNDKTIHYVMVGVDTTQAIIYTFKPADTSYAINWRTDVTGKLLATAYSDNSGTRIVPNSTYADRFQAQMTYWDAIVPTSASVALNASGR